MVEKNGLRRSSGGVPAAPRGPLRRATPRLRLVVRDGSWCALNEKHFVHLRCLLRRAVASSGSCQLRGTQGGRRYITTHVRIPANLRGTFTVAREGYFSRDCVPRRRAAQDHGNPNSWLISSYFRSAALCCCITRSSKNCTCGWQSR